MNTMEYVMLVIGLVVTLGGFWKCMNILITGEWVAKKNEIANEDDYILTEYLEEW